MSKTPEEMAYDYGEKFNGVEISKNDINIAWYDGYKAAQEHAHAALEEAEAKIDKLQTKLSDAGILTTDHILDATKMVDVHGWISVKDRMPGECAGLLIVYHAYLKEIGTSYYDDDMWCSSPWPINSEGITHWMPLPEPPKEEK